MLELYNQIAMEIFTSHKPTNSQSPFRATFSASGVQTKVLPLSLPAPKSFQYQTNFGVRSTFIIFHQQAIKSLSTLHRIVFQIFHQDYGQHHH